MEYDCIVIGAGVGGLFSAFELSRKGKKVLLLERQPVPGGYATTFQRKGFTFESSIHCVDSLSSGGEIRNFLEECGIAKKINFIELKDFSHIIYPEHNFVADFNHDNLIGFLKNSFPQESENLDKLFLEFDKFYKQFDSFDNSKLPLWIKLALSPFIYSYIIRASCCSIEQFINRYINDIKLKGILTDIWYYMGLPPGRLSAFYFLIIFREYYYKPNAYIKGGLAQLFKAMVNAIEENGSDVRLNTTVEKIITERGKKVKAVVLDNAEELQAKAIISNANAIDTLTKLLDNDSLKEEYRKQLSTLEKSISGFQVYLGLNIPAKDLGMRHFMLSIKKSYNHDQNFNSTASGNYDQCSLAIVDHAQVDPSFVPSGKGSLLIMTVDYYANWKDLGEEEYKKKKIEVANNLIKQTEVYLPGLSGHIEVLEVATPLTLHRYSLSPEGALYGFAQSVGQAGMNRLSQKTKVKGLFLAGAWTRPGGGVHGCFISGVDAANLALRFLT